VLAAAVAAMLLSSCGEAFRSPAAVVDGREITHEELGRETEILFADPRLAPELQGPDGRSLRAARTRELLTLLIQHEVVFGYAERNDISVNDEEVQEQLDRVIQESGGRETFDRLLADRGLTEADVRRSLERNLLLQKVNEAVLGDDGAPPVFGEEAPPDAGEIAVFRMWYLDQLERVEIVVNPRFGRFDRQTGEVVPITSTRT
jgi:SurA N-terminal domain